MSTSVLSLFQVQCYDTQAAIDSVCQEWGVAQCQTPLEFSAIIDLYAADKEGNDSYLPILEVTSNQSAKLSHPTCSSMNRLQHCMALCDNSELMKYLDAPEVMPTLSQIMSYFSFWMFLALMILAWSFFASTVTLSDTVCFMLLGQFIALYLLYLKLIFFTKLNIVVLYWRGEPPDHKG